METFDGPIVEADRGGAYVRVPPEVVEALGSKGRIPVQATFDGIAYRGSVVSMGGQKVLGLLKAIRAELGKRPGDIVTVTVELDRAERSIPVPDDLRVSLDRAGLGATFDGLSYSHRREYVSWIDEAKKADTRSRRISQTVDRIRG
ncbi:MAG TPA: YdeI/OmpD-associated family protein [Acidimicrobiales bacterium]|nr:YdeI/OmpD-associated family protein [Acidimicrobiales bacterium]